MARVIIAGVDPGLVHTGVVCLVLDEEERQVELTYTVVDGPNADEVEAWLHAYTPDVVYIEDYRPRSQFDTNARMVQAVHDMKTVIPRSKVIDNTGGETLVRPSLMKKLGVWSFATKTNHQDLRSAARILLVGILKDKAQEDYITVLNSFMAAAVMGFDWKVVDCND